MSSPPVKYLRYFDFTTFASLNPEKPLPGASVDVEFNRLKSTTDQTIDRLALIQRDDGGLRDGMVTTSALADGSVTTPKLADYAVTNPKLANQSVDSRVLAPASVHGANIVDGTIQTNNLADAAVTSAKLAYNLNLGDISANNFTVVNNASVFGIFDAMGFLHAHQNFTVDGTSTFNGPVNFSQPITLPPGTISGGSLAPGSVGTTQLADLSVTTPKLADGAVTNAKLGTGSVDSSKIVDGSIAPADLSAATIALMTAAGNPRGAWLTNTDYATKDAVTNGPGVYVCITAHHSGVFATDLAAGKWYQTGTIYDQSLNTTDAVRFQGLAIQHDFNGDTGLRVQNTDLGAAARMFNVWDNGATQLVISHPGQNFTPGNFYNQPNVSAIYSTGGSLRIGTLNAVPLVFATATAERMRLDGNGNLGIGMVPVNILDITQNVNGNALVQLTNANTTAGGTAQAAFRAANGTNAIDFGVYGSATGAGGPAPQNYGHITSYASGLSIITNGPSHPILFCTNNFIRMTLDGDNYKLTLGTASPAWDAGTVVFSFGSGASVSAGLNPSSASASFTCNTYFDGANHRYLTTNAASVYVQANGDHIFYNAPNAAAGTVAPYAEHFRVTAAGKLTIGLTGNWGGAWADFAGPGNVVSGYCTDTGGGCFIARVNDNRPHFMDFFYNTTKVGYIYSADGVNTSYLTGASDRRLKNITGDFANSGAIIDALHPKFGTWISNGNLFIGLIADDVQAIAELAMDVVGDKDAVDEDGNPIPQMMTYTSPTMMTCIIAELKSLRARVAAGGL